MSTFVFPESLPPPSALRQAIMAAYRKDEATCLEELLVAAELPNNVVQNIQQIAEKLVIAVREQRLGKGGLDAFLYEYDLENNTYISPLLETTKVSVGAACYVSQ